MRFCDTSTHIHPLCRRESNPPVRPALSHPANLQTIESGNLSRIRPHSKHHVYRGHLRGQHLPPRLGRLIPTPVEISIIIIIIYYFYFSLFPPRQAQLAHPARSSHRRLYRGHHRDGGRRWRPGRPQAAARVGQGGPALVLYQVRRQDQEAARRQRERGVAQLRYQAEGGRAEAARRERHRRQDGRAAAARVHGAQDGRDAAEGEGEGRGEGEADQPGACGEAVGIGEVFFFQCRSSRSRSRSRSRRRLEGGVVRPQEYNGVVQPGQQQRHHARLHSGAGAWTRRRPAAAAAAAAEEPAPVHRGRGPSQDSPSWWSEGDYVSTHRRGYLVGSSSSWCGVGRINSIIISSGTRTDGTAGTDNFTWPLTPVIHHHHRR